MKLRSKDSGSRRLHSKYPDRITNDPSHHMLTKVADFKGSCWNAFIRQSETVITSFLRISDGEKLNLCSLKDVGYDKKYNQYYYAAYSSESQISL
ncbi:MAG: hypothetical protein EZS28_022928, partial [Streblomastix strix]